MKKLSNFLYIDSKKDKDQDTRPLDFLRLIFLVALGTILEKVMTRLEKKDLPKSVGNFAFIERFKKETIILPVFQYGIYENNNGQRALAKYWQGKSKNLAYFTLKNEINIYKTLNHVQSKLRGKIPKELKSISIPQILLSEENNNSLIVLIEFIDNAKIAQNENPKNKIKIYLKVIDYLKFLGDNLSEDEKSRISVRTSLNLVFLYPFILIKSILTHPKNAADMLKASLVFLRSIPLLLKDNRMTLSHRDLRFKNILIKNKKIYLIDLEYCAFTNPFYELANSFHSYWKENKFEKIFLNVLKRRFQKEPNFQPIFKGLLVDTVIHALNDNYYSERKIQKYINCLKFAQREAI